MKYGRTILAGVIGAFVGNGILGAFFSSPPVKRILYDEQIQSELFRTITPLRNIPVSVAGLVLLGAIPGILYGLLAPSIPGNTTLRKGLFWGFAIWGLYWVHQEWFIYFTLLKEPWYLCAMELTILLVGSLVQGVLTAIIVGVGREENA
jgi:hypothetical protein